MQETKRYFSGNMKRSARVEGNSSLNASPSPPGKTSPPKVLGVFLLTMINISAIISIRAWPSLAPLGFSSAFFWVLDGFIFMIPLSLVCAELATGWPKTGGIYVWVREGLGDRLGFVTGWLYWIENVVWFPTILTFLAATAAYLINPALASNTLYNVVMILVIFWAATLVNLRGMKTSGWISTVCAILGTLIPAVLIIGLATVWLGTGQPSQTPLTAQAFFPQVINSTAPNLPPKALLAFPLEQWIANATNFSSISLASSLILYYAGMELTGAHAAEVKNPNHDFPKAVLFSTIATIVISVLGTLAVAIVVPAQQIGLASGIMEAFQDFLSPYRLGWFVPVMALMIVIGSLGGVNSWLVGPNKSLMATALHGDLPPILQRVNKKFVPTALLYLQGIIGSLLALVYLLLPSVNAGYWYLTVVTSQIYCILYIMLFIAAIRLRYTQPNVQRAYKIPGGNLGMWFVSVVGLLATVFAFIIGFAPPTQVSFGQIFASSTLAYVIPVATAMIVCCLVPLWAFKFRKPEWVSEARKLGLEED